MHEMIEFSYYNNQEGEQFEFIEIPKDLYLDEQFKGVSTESKLIYNFMLTEIKTSSERRMKDEKGRLYIFCDEKKVRAELGFNYKQREECLIELENIRLVEVDYNASPNKIYVKNFNKRIG